MPTGVYVRTTKYRQECSFRMRGSNHPMYGKHHSKDAKLKISESNKKSLKGRTLTAEHKRAISRAKMGHIVSNETKEKLRSINLGKHLTDETKLLIGKQNIGRKHSVVSIQKMKDIVKKQYNIGRVPYFRGKHLSNEMKDKLRKSNVGKMRSSMTRMKMRVSAINRIEREKLNGGQLIPSFNSSACRRIDEYGKQCGYNFQHAMNGGEFHIKKLGYWVDGYDKEKNVVIEIDEHRHFNADGSLKKRDVERQKEIEQYLGCKFIRLRLE
jgi:hypothetical protein